VVKPIIKWPGGKRQIINELLVRLPQTWNRYYEPFIGGGALLINLYNTQRLFEATISDANEELINLYRIIKTKPDELIESLKNITFTNSRKRYLQNRSAFNSMKGKKAFDVERAAYFIYLNKHGFNGLWRVNKNGNFNVPFGRYRNPQLPTQDHIKALSQMLKNVAILHQDFEQTVSTVRRKDFIYFDPPYQPISSTSNFTDYQPGGFDFGNQARLAMVCRNLTKKGVFLMVSNSDSPQVIGLYKGFTIERITANRAINSRPDRRSGILELVITNYSINDQLTCCCINNKI